MNRNRISSPRRFNRRDCLRLSGSGALASVLAGGGLPIRSLAAACRAGAVCRRLVATDGYISLPERRDQPLYVFGFREVLPSEVDATIQAVTAIYKGNVQTSAPILAVDQEVDLYLTLTNIGLMVRFDLDDAHTIHWHGFRNPIALFDGVPEVSISVPVSRNFPYFYRPHDPGTYMYHCHFEDVEHVQMGMNGIVFVRPLQNRIGAGGGVPVARLGGNPSSPAQGYAYNDGDGSTAYDREFALMLNEFDTNPHDGLEAVQEFIWNQYKPNYWIINGRAYPDTLLLNNDSSLPNQPISSLIQVNAGDRVLLRLANLGYEQHTMVLPGVAMSVVGHDATLLRPSVRYVTNSIYIGPGEARDVLFVAPPHSGGGFTTYRFMNRSPHKLSNNGATGLGGMVTELRVYAAGTLPPQTQPNETYAT